MQCYSPHVILSCVTKENYPHLQKMRNNFNLNNLKRKFMRLFTLMAAFAFCAMTTNAQTLKVTNAPKAKVSTVRKADLQQPAELKKPMYAPGDELIEDFPEGEKKVYSCFTWLVSPQSGEGYWRDGVKTNVVFGENNEVYVQNFITYYPYGTWIKGQLNEDKTEITFPNHQPYYEQNNYFYYVSVCTVDEDGSVWADTEAESFTLSYDAETGVFANESLEICLVNEDGGVFTYNQFYEFTPFSDELVQLPAGLDIQPYSLKFETTYAYDYPMIAYVARDGNDFYISGLNDKNPNSWIKGSLEGDSVIFQNFQYVGLYNDLYFLYFKGAKFTEFDNTGWPVYKSSDYLALAYNPEDKSLKGDYGMLFVLGKKSGSYSQSITTQEMYVFNQVPATPKDPVIRYWDGVKDEYNMPFSMNFVVPVEDVDGNFINPDSLSYRFFFDNEVWVFHQDFYPYMQEGQTEVPAKWQDNNRSSFLGSYHAFNFPNTISPTILGLQSIYVSNGERRESNIVTRLATDIETTTAIKDKVVDYVQYFDLSGCLVETPVRGIYIKSVTYTDGTKENTKIVK